MSERIDSFNDGNTVLAVFVLILHVFLFDAPQEPE